MVDYYLPENIKKEFSEKLEAYINEDKPFRWILHSVSPGTGKTSTVNEVIKVMENNFIQYIRFSGSNSYSVEDNNEIQKTLSIRGKTLVIIEEFEHLNKVHQNGFKVIMDDYTKASFIIVTNSTKSITDYINSRCIPYHYDFPKKDVLAFMVKKYNVVKEEYNDVLQSCYPDMRKFVKQLELIRSNSSAIVNTTKITNYSWIGTNQFNNKFLAIMYDTSVIDIDHLILYIVETYGIDFMLGIIPSDTNYNKCVLHILLNLHKKLIK